jgi:hypothetical protein
MQGEKLVQSLPVTSPGLVQETSGFRGVIGHKHPYPVRTPEGAVYWTGGEKFFGKLSGSSSFCSIF